MSFRLKNLWYEVLPDRHLTVYAGGEGSAGDVAQGGLSIVNKTLDELDIMAPSEYYRTPTKAGPVTITDAVGERLTLDAPDGTRFYFDVATRQWVNP